MTSTWLFIFRVQQLISCCEENSTDFFHIAFFFESKVRHNYEKEKSHFWGLTLKSWRECEQALQWFKGLISLTKDAVLGSKSQNHQWCLWELGDVFGQTANSSNEFIISGCHFSRISFSLSRSLSLPLSQSRFLPVILPTAAPLSIIPRESASSVRRFVSCKAVFKESPQSTGCLLYF